MKLFVAAALACAAWVSAARAQAPVARLEIEPARAAIGDPVTWTLVVEAPATARVTLPDLADLPREWALVERLGVRRDPVESDPTRRVTRAAWRVMALDGGDLEPPRLKVTVESNGARVEVEAETPKLAVDHALGPGEDAPRPARGFRPAPDPRMLSPRLVVNGIALGVLLLIAWLVRKRFRRKPAPAPAVNPLARLSGIETRLAAEPEAGRERAFELTRLVRESVDAFLGESNRSLTDAAWSGRVTADERLPAGVRSAAARLLAESERVKYAHESLSPFAEREALANARAILETLASTPAPQPVASTSSGKEAA